MDFGPEPVGEAFNGESSLEGEDQNGGPAEGGPCGGLGEEDEEETEGVVSSTRQTISSTRMRTQSYATFSALSITHVLQAIDILTGPGSGHLSFCGPVEARPLK
jgi:hypothetical protein